MNWDHLITGAWHKIAAIGSAIGLTGSGIGLVKYLRHATAPYQDQPQLGAIFDTLQDLASNNSRIGERRTRAGAVVPPVPATREVPPPVAAPVVDEGEGTK